MLERHPLFPEELNATMRLRSWIAQRKWANAYKAADALDTLRQDFPLRDIVVPIRGDR